MASEGLVSLGCVGIAVTFGSVMVFGIAKPLSIVMWFAIGMTFGIVMVFGIAMPFGIVMWFGIGMMSLSRLDGFVSWRSLLVMTSFCVYDAIISIRGYCLVFLATFSDAIGTIVPSLSHL